VKRWTPEQIQWIRREYLRLDLVNLTAAFNNVWGESVTVKQVRAAIRNRGITSGRTGQFTKEAPGRRKNPVPKGDGPGRFKKGERRGAAHRNYVPIGTERITRDGYIERKVTDDPALVPARRWVPVHRIVWEEAHGPIPEGHALVFLDGDPQNIALENLRCVHRGVLQRLNHRANRVKAGKLKGEARTAMLLAAELEYRTGERAKA
jgi:hypothetical protein